MIKSYEYYLSYITLVVIFLFNSFSFKAPTEEDLLLDILIKSDSLIELICISNFLNLKHSNNQEFWVQ